MVLLVLLVLPAFQAPLELRWLAGAGGMSWNVVGDAVGAGAEDDSECWCEVGPDARWGGLGWGGG